MNERSFNVKSDAVLEEGAVAGRLACEADAHLVRLCIFACAGKRCVFETQVRFKLLRITGW